MTIPRFIRVFSRRVLLMALPMLIPFSVIADETEIFFQNDAAAANANVLFLLDGSGSMDSVLSGGSDSRMQVMKNAFREVMEGAPDNINIGLMHYANTPTGTGYGWSSIKGVTFPVSPADEDAADVIGASAATDNISVSTSADGEELNVKEFLANVVDTWQPSGYTPIVDSLYEAALYFKGDEVVWGKFPPEYKWAAHPSSYTGSMQCVGSQTESCTQEWQQCNGSEQNCVESVIPNICCNWLVNAAGDEYCEGGDYSCSDTITRCEHTVCDSISGDVAYSSPIENACQSNYLVLMSDGKPEYTYYPSRTADGTGRYAKSAYPDQNHDYNQMPRLLPDLNSQHITTAIPALIEGTCTDSPNGYASGTCGPELTEFLAANDLNSELEGDQTVDTYTVAFGLGDEPAGTAYLASLATAENGAYTADNASELSAAFQSVFGEIEKNSFSFSSPSFSVSEDSLLSHGSNVYVPVMDVARTTVWSGNLRKFTLADSGSIVSSDGVTPALNSAGEFEDSAQDLWSGTAHGANVTEGGAANKIPNPDDRTLYTDPASTGLVSITTGATEAELPSDLFGEVETYQTEHDLQDWLGGEADGNSLYGWYIDCDGNRQTVNLLGNNGAIKGPVNIAEVTTCTGVDVSIEERDTLINFMRGYVDGVTGEDAVVRKHMGDMLNTKPVVVTYEADGGTNKTLVFAATNEGYLHAINSVSGVEEWAFMPSSLLKNQVKFLSNEPSQDHVYGLDGPVTLWQFTDDQGADKKYLFFGMRRGGNMVYALDISSSIPRIAWKISPSGDFGADSTGFSDLGETWSKPTLSRMKDPSDPSKTLDVLVFGGGYDARKEEQDASARASGAGLGSDVYIVNALTGELVWSLKGDSVSGSSDLVHSVPGDIRVLDMNGDGALDRLYFADTGGHIWRVDITTSVTGSGDDVSLALDATLTEFADLGASTANGASADGDRRKFFYEPDTALRLSNGIPTLTVSIGSGYRTHPLDLGDEDRFYVLLDKNIYNIPPEDFSTITEGDLMSVSELRASASGNILHEADKRGWYYPLPHSGEKVLASSLTFLDKVLFTTFALADEDGVASSAAVCEPAVNTSRAYVLDLLTSLPVANLDREVITTGEGENATTTVTAEDFIVAGYNEILDAPQLIFSELTSAAGGDCSHGDCQQSVSVRIGRLDIPLLDMDNSAENANAGGAYSGSVDLTKILPRLFWRDDDVVATDKLEGIDSSDP